MNKPTLIIDKDRPAQYKESGTRKERTACLAKHVRPPSKINPRHDRVNRAQPIRRDSGNS